MGSIQKTIHYCSVSKGAQILYAYNGADHEIENLAALCLERTPPYHKWYFQTMAKKIFGFLMEDVYVYFIIAHESLGKAEALRFLEHLRDESKKLEKKGASRSKSTLNSLCLQEQLVPVIRHLITSLENVPGTGSDWPIETSLQDKADLSPSPCNSSNGLIEGGASTKAPLLGKSSKQEKKKMKDHVIPIRDVEEHCRSTERGIKVNSGALDSTNRGVSVSPVSLQKDITLTRTRSSSQNTRRKWCRQVRIVLIIDAVVCLVLLAIWLVICNGVECVR